MHPTKSRYFKCVILENIFRMEGDDVGVAGIHARRRHLLVWQREVAASRQQKQGQQEDGMGDVLEGCRSFLLSQDQSQRSLGHRAMTMRKAPPKLSAIRINALMVTDSAGPRWGRASFFGHAGGCAAKETQSRHESSASDDP